MVAPRGTRRQDNAVTFLLAQCQTPSERTNTMLVNPVFSLEPTPNDAQNQSAQLLKITD